MKLAVKGCYNGLAVWSKAVTRHKIPGKAGFLVISLHRICQPLIRTGFQVANPVAGLGIVPGGVDQPLSIRRHRRPHSAANFTGKSKYLTHFPIINCNLKIKPGQVITPPTHFGCEINISIIRTKSSAHSIAIFIFFLGKQIHSRSAIDMVNPQMLHT